MGESVFGVSFAEFLVVFLVAILVVPVKNWPDIARFIAKVIKFIRNLIWKITDAGEQIKSQIELEKPINDLIKSTTDDVLGSFSEPLKKINTKKMVNKKTVNKINKQMPGKK